ncbi:MAG: hypothetical protein Terrestrivirus4_127 [Terrestrivirus sp.]|uniref:Uncharacterized protein n=1 Tax=Terrestrivirus sp. TaxID=2487775 RepID=A0A3G4ZRM8_9VIRU|nr:MAG: hypothetical protein Terrestrivirus4_127 [Terrestrivirus sp.]
MEFKLRGGSIIDGKYVPRVYGIVMNNCIHENMSKQTNPEVMAIIEKYKKRGFSFTAPSDQHNNPEMDKHDMLCRDVFTDPNPETLDVLCSERGIVTADEKTITEKRKNETDNTESNKKFKHNGGVICVARVEDVDMEYVD